MTTDPSPPAPDTPAASAPAPPASDTPAPALSDDRARPFGASEPATRRPSAPATLPKDPADVTSRLGAEVALSDAVARRLSGVCRDIDTGLASRVEAGRDWWPLAVSWAVSGSVPAIPGAVARPGSVAEVSAVLAVCDEARVPVTAMAGRSGVCGASVPVFGGVALDLTGLRGLVSVDDESLLVDIRPGTWGDEIEDTLRRDHDLTLGHWPQSMAISTVGGWVACRGAGQYSTRYGKIEDIVAGLEVVLANGRVVRTGGTAPRAAVGPDLTQLFVGSEGTLGIITEVRLRAHPVPAGEGRAAWAFASFSDGLDTCRRILRRGATPAVLRLYDRTESIRHFESADLESADVEGGSAGDGSPFDCAGGCVLIVVDEADPGLVDATMAVVAEECAPAREIDAGVAGHWLAHRNEIPSLEGLARAGIVADTVEVAARWRELPAIYEEAVAAVAAIDATLAVSAHQSHAYTDGGCLYFTFAGRPSPGGRLAAEAYYRAALDAVTGVVLRHGGALSHHHGVGLNRSRYMEAGLGGGLDVLAAVKASLDPRGILNPGKLGLPSPFGSAPWP